VAPLPTFLTVACTADTTGFGALVQEWLDSFEDFRADTTEFIDRGEYVVVSLVLRGRVRGSDEEVALPETHVWKMREGKAVEGARISDPPCRIGGHGTNYRTLTSDRRG
jgi:hypothetical protein